MENWRRLTRHYAEMSDGELIALAEDFRDLVETARQVLRDEMRKRGLGDPQSYAETQLTRREDAQSNVSATAIAGGQTSPYDAFVWKNVLCDCSSREEAWQIFEALRRAGIESWIDGSQMQYTPLPDLGANGSRHRVLVAAGQLDVARAILAQPIPQDIVEQSKAEEPEYEPPVCPACGAPDPLLEGVDPVNSWKCEVCGRQWTESAQETE